MRKLLVYVCLSVLSLLAAWGKPVDTNTAKLAAYNFLMQQGAKQLVLIDVSNSEQFSALYFFANKDGEGFAIMPKYDCALPILGYSVDSKIDMENLPVNAAAWYAAYNNEVARLEREGVVASDSVRNEWQRLLKNEPSTTLSKASVSPLIGTHWNQSPYYNKFCPGSGSSQAVAGCVATAMAQVMRYWQHPAVGRGSYSYNQDPYGTISADFGATTYDWAHMPSRLSSSSSTEEVNAVATLMYHAGVAVEMYYSPGGSGASTATIQGMLDYPCAENALKNYFGYSSSLYNVSKSGYTDAEWSRILKAELNAAHPILYTGYSQSSGHCFVCDGYNAISRFHFNWGWDGLGDGYYALGNLNPAPGGIGGNASSSYNDMNSILVGVQPAATTGETSVITVVPNHSEYGTVTGGGTYTNYDDVVLLSATANEGYRFVQWDDGCAYNPRKFYANEDKTLTAIFEPVGGAEITYGAHTVENYGEYAYWGIRVPQMSLSYGSRIDSVSFYCCERATYELRFYSGAQPVPGRVEYAQEYNVERGHSWSWVTVPLDSSYVVDPTKPLWIVVHCDDANWRGGLTSYCGNPDGSWCSDDGTTWSHHTDGTWAIKAYVTQDEVYTVTAVPNDSAMGSVEGAGVYAAGATATLRAIPAQGYRFVVWSNGEVGITDNPYVFTVDSNMGFVAVFEPEIGFDAVDGIALQVYPNPTRQQLRVECADLLLLELFDAAGRKVYVSYDSGSIDMSAYHPGIYTLRVVTSQGTAVRRVVRQ